MHRAVRRENRPKSKTEQTSCINQPDAQGGAAPNIATTGAPRRSLHQSARCTGRCGLVFGTGQGMRLDGCINQPDAQGGAAPQGPAQPRHRAYVASISPMHRAVRHPKDQHSHDIEHTLHQSARCTGRCGGAPPLEGPGIDVVASISPMHRAVRHPGQLDLGGVDTGCINQPDAQGGAASRRRICPMLGECVASISPMHRAVRHPGSRMHRGGERVVASISPMHRAVRPLMMSLVGEKERSCINQPDAQGGAALSISNPSTMQG